MDTKEFVSFRIEKQFQHSGLVSEHHALGQLGVLCNSDLVRNSLCCECFLGLTNHRDCWNCVNPIRKQFGHMFKGNSKHMTRGQTSLFHGGACKSGESNDVASCVNVRNASLKELVDIKSPAGVSRQSRSFQMKLVAVGLSAHGINESLGVYLFATL